MRKEILLTIALSSGIFSCSGMQITEQNVRKELQSAAESINSDKKSIYKLDSKTVGKKGYFYLINSKGTISHHPKKGLINSDFSRFPFIQRILKERNGCLSFNADGTSRYLFFNETKGGEILCLTIDMSEFNEPVYGCDSNAEEKK
jgi:hypothetical protein